VLVLDFLTYKSMTACTQETPKAPAGADSSKGLGCLGRTPLILGDMRRCCEPRSD